MSSFKINIVDIIMSIGNKALPILKIMIKLITRFIACCSNSKQITCPNHLDHKKFML